MPVIILFDSTSINGIYVFKFDVRKFFSVFFLSLTFFQLSVHYVFDLFAWLRVDERSSDSYIGGDNFFSF